MELLYEAVVDLSSGDVRKFPVDGMKQSIFVDDGGMLYIQPRAGEICFVAASGTWDLVVIQDRKEAVSG